VPNYADPADAVIGWLTTVIDVGADVRPDEGYRRLLPEDPESIQVDDLPLGVLVRVGGFDPHPGLDMVRLNVDTYCTGPDPFAARSAALARAEDIRRAVRLWLPGALLPFDDGDVKISKTVTESAPTIRPYGSRQIRKAQAVYGIWFHRAI
jgi:hypothetical protein